MANLSCVVRLFFAGKKLRDLDITSKSDPYATVAMDGGKTNLGRTETIQNCCDPVWKKSFEVPYFFEARQDFTVSIFDDDGAQGELIGTVTFQLANVMSSAGCKKDFPVSTGGVLSVAAEVASSTGRDTVDIKFEGTRLKNMDLIGKSDPYYRFSRRLPNGELSLIHKSECAENTLEPRWMPVRTQLVSRLTTADFNAKTLVLECFDQDMSSDESMGSVTFSFQELITAHQTRQPLKLRGATGKDEFGDIVVAQCAITRKPTFADFLRGGLQLNLAVAVDFTASNGDPQTPKSLHYRDPQNPNQYMKAIMSVCDVLMEYDADKQVAAFGFGAQEPMPSNVITHFFHLNMQPNPYVVGVQGVIDAYAASLNRMRLAGPTNFAPTIDNVRELLAKRSRDTYTVLLILTDGAITDMVQTKQAIAACGTVPMSIVIVGVGNDEFSNMTELDNDENKGQKRDLVQFVPFRDFMRSPPAALAAEVLREIPAQVEQWADINGVRPPQSR
jgi:hypothetical protein